MDTKTKEMIQTWLAMHRGDREAVARFIASTLNVCCIKEARLLVKKAIS